MREAEMKQQATRKIRSANSRIGPFPERAQARFCTSLSGIRDEKIFENLPRVFLRKNPGANCEKPNQPKKIERTPTRPLDHE